MKMKMIFTMFFIFAMTPMVFAQTNGSFENGTNPGYIMTVYPSQTDINGWTIASGNVDYIDSNWWQASDGNRSLDLNGDTAGGNINQSLPTVSGLMYQVTFDMSGNPDGGSNMKTMSVSASGSASQNFSYDTTANANNHSDMKYISNTYYFLANSNSTVLSFASTMGGPFGAVLDNVNVTNITAQICHRDKGKPGQKTLTVGVSAIQAHLNHGDTLGPCQQPA